MRKNGAVFFGALAYPALALIKRDDKFGAEPVGTMEDGISRQ
jgi:hypothetical protein